MNVFPRPVLIPYIVTPSTTKRTPMVGVPPRTQHFYTKFLYIKGVTPYKSYSQSVSFLYQSPLFRSLATSLLGGAWQEFCNPTFSKM